MKWLLENKNNPVSFPGSSFIPSLGTRLHNNPHSRKSVVVMATKGIQSDRYSFALQKYYNRKFHQQGKIVHTLKCTHSRVKGEDHPLYLAFSFY